MKRILFVDDEQHVLDGLRNALRKQREQWEMHFALGGKAALETMQDAPFDVIVSDMRMPGMDGAALLQQVKQQHPETCRLVLTGHAEREAIMRALPVAHQFITKPCEIEDLRVIIDRACNLNRLLRNDAIRKVAGRVESLPSVPKTYWQLTEAVAAPDVGLATIAEIVQRDPSMTVKVLQIVNSAYFGLSREVTTIQQAVTYIGLELLKGLTLTAHVFGAPSQHEIVGFSADTVQRHSLLTAKLGKQFAPHARLGEEVFTAAVVHDVGKLILAMASPETYGEIIARSAASGRPLHEVEKETLGACHTEVGAYLLGMWGLPFPIVEAVAHHHVPSAITEGPCEVLAALHVAAAFVETSDDDTTPLEDRVDMPFLERCGLIPQLDTWWEIARGEFQRVRAAA